MLCIRGFARMGNLAIVSKADESYQRDLIKEHKKEVLDFLRKKETLFFPEIILSYSIDDLQFGGENFKYNDKFLRITTKTNRYANKNDTRGKDSIQIATINLKPQHFGFYDENRPDYEQHVTGFDGHLMFDEDKNKIFNRIDGNHRLSAADEERDDSIQDLITPFCLLLLPKASENRTTEILEKTIFHNINYKHIPLKKEHHYKMMIGDETIFNDDELSDDFGEEYYRSRLYLQTYNYDEFSGLKEALAGNIYTFTHDLQKLLLDEGQADYFETVYRALKLINKIYNNHEQLLQHQHYGLLIAFVYFSVRKDKALSEKELNAFAYWVVENFVYEIAKKDANSIIGMYKNIIERRYKEIFISMDFSKNHKATYQAIEGVVDAINQENSTTIKLCPVRIDQFKTGYSYKLDDEIFKQIEKCGLMIADLSGNNVNVYQEVGFAMGLNNNNTDKENILLLKKDTEKNKSADSEVGFNLRSTKQLRFTGTENLRKSLKEELLEYYKLSVL